MDKEKQTEDVFQDFFSFMSREHNIILTQTEIFDILHEANKLQSKLNRSKDFMK